MCVSTLCSQQAARLDIMMNSGMARNGMLEISRSALLQMKTYVVTMPAGHAAASAGGKPSTDTTMIAIEGNLF